MTITGNELKHIIKAAMIFSTLFTLVSVWTGIASADTAPLNNATVIQVPSGLAVNPLGAQPALVSKPGGTQVIVVNTQPAFNPFARNVFFNPFLGDEADEFGFGFGLGERIGFGEAD